ncbi:MAG: class I SAM-dependent methyltransferase [Bryobacterales bacterium]|nr:class I SAM-dependent methyltransferase [Bryobacterales bacterium]
MEAEQDRIKRVPAHLRYLERASELARLDLRERFSHIYRTNLWGSEESVSGSGSAIDQTAAIRKRLPALLHKYKITSMLDLPCGDFGWMREVDLTGIDYCGGDIVADLIVQHQRDHEGTGRRFQVLDLTRDPLPRMDLVFCRDCLVHLSFAHIWDAIRNLKASGSEWLLTTTFPEHRTNHDIDDGDWRLLNLEEPPFCFPPPVDLVLEDCAEHDGAFADKSLGLWRIAALPNEPASAGDKAGTIS